MVWRIMIACVVLICTSISSAQEKRRLPPVSPITREVLEAEQAREKAGLLAPPLSPEAQVRFNAYTARLDNLYAESKEATTMADAFRLLEALYEDMGSPGLNDRWQENVVDEIQHAASRPGTEADVLAAFRTGLLNYAAEGGGGADPSSQIHLSIALATLGGPACSECDRVANDFAEEATKWAAELKSQSYINIVESRRQDVDRITKVTQKRGAGPATTQAPNPARAFEEAETAMRALALSADVSVQTLEKATRLATADFGRKEVSDDMVARLLIAYKLALKERRKTPRDVVRGIDAKLLWFARDSQKLVTQEHWQLWEEAVTELGVRISSELRRYIARDGAKQHSDPFILETLRKTEKELERKSTGRPGVVPTSQAASPSSQPAGRTP